MGREELEAITVIYQVQIRTFKEGNNNSESNVTCIEQIGRSYGRVVNLLWKDGEWALLLYGGEKVGKEGKEGEQEGRIGREEWERQGEVVKEIARGVLDSKGGEEQWGAKRVKNFREDMMEIEFFKKDRYEGRKREEKQRKEKEKDQTVEELGVDKPNSTGGKGDRVEGEIGKGKYRSVWKEKQSDREGARERDKESEEMRRVEEAQNPQEKEGVERENRRERENEGKGSREELDNMEKVGWQGEIASECSSFDLLDRKELEQWLEQKIEGRSLTDKGRVEEKDSANKIKRKTESNEGEKEESRGIRRKGRISGEAGNEEKEREEVRNNGGREQGREIWGGSTSDSSEGELLESGKLQRWLEYLTEEGGKAEGEEVEKVTQEDILFRNIEVKERTNGGEKIRSREGEGSEPSTPIENSKAWEYSRGGKEEGSRGKAKGEGDSTGRKEKIQRHREEDEEEKGKMKESGMGGSQQEWEKGKTERKGEKKQREVGEIEERPKEGGEKEENGVKPEQRRGCKEMGRGIGEGKTLVIGSERQTREVEEKQGMQKEGKKREKIDIERKDRIEEGGERDTRKEWSREQHRETISQCSSIDLLDRKELDKWLEQMVGKLNIASEEEEIKEKINRIESKERQREKGKGKKVEVETGERQRKGDRHEGKRLAVEQEFNKKEEEEKDRYVGRSDVDNAPKVKEKSLVNYRQHRLGERQEREEGEQNIGLEGRQKEIRAGGEEKMQQKGGRREDNNRETRSNRGGNNEGERTERESLERPRREERGIVRRNEEKEKRIEGRMEEGEGRTRRKELRTIGRLNNGALDSELGVIVDSNSLLDYRVEVVEEKEVESREQRIRKRKIEEEGVADGIEEQGTDANIQEEAKSSEEMCNLEQLGGRGEREEGVDTRESEGEITTSSIAALFWDRDSDRENRGLVNRNITRRRVWERWKGVVRGGIRRINKKKKKIEKIVEREKEENRLVFDYTTKTLSPEETQLLGRGEGFCVVDHKIDEDRNRVDIYNFQRRLRLHEFFRDRGNIEEIEEEGRQTPARRETIVGGRGGREEELMSVRRGGNNNVENIDRRGSIRSRVGGVENIEEERVVGRRTPVRRRTILGGRGGRGSVLDTGRRGNRRSVGTTDRRGNRESREDTTRGVSSRGGNGRSENRRESTQGGTRELGGKEIGRRLPSIYDPDSKNRNLNRYNVCIQEEILLSMEKKVQFRDNISKVERKALKSLKHRIGEKEIVITRADKGSGLVAVDYNTYIEKGTKYIEEEAGAYTKVQEAEQDIIDRLSKDRNKVAEQLKEKGVISVQTATYIKKQLEEKITGIKFYYKIHKDRNIATMPLRPLQSCIKAPMQYLSIVLTDILQPLLTEKNIPSFIFDSNQLLYRLRSLGRIPDSCTLISSDVSALYPSIPHREGFRAMRDFLQERTSYNTAQINSIIRALELVITENYMVWNKQIYKQVSGVAMGTPVAVAYANIFMDWVDKQVRQRAPYIYEHIRFIDDNLFILPEDRVEELIETANNILPPYIKFTYEKLQEGTGRGLPFLDTELFISVEKSIESRLYTKKTDRHAYLLPSSYHPPHITQNIPMAVFGRIRKLCSREEWFREDAEKAVGWLLNRGYKKAEIEKAVERTTLKNRWDMIEQIEKKRHTSTQKEEGEVVDIPFITTYSQHGGMIKKVLKDRQPLLNTSFTRTRVRPRVSYRRRKNLNDLVVQKGLRGPIENNSKELNIFSECGEKPGYRSRCPCKGKHSQEKCRCCMHRKSELEGIDCKLYKPVSCNSKNVVYIIGCRECSKKYIGETQQRLKDRLAQHMYNVDKLNQPLYLHFRYVHKLENLYIGILETVRGGEAFMRKVREAWWINYLKTLEPRGFNIKLECNQVYEATS